MCMCQRRANRNIWAGYRMGQSPTPTSPLTPIPRVRKVPLRNCSQIGDHKLNTSCGVVDRPDHHCGDDLVELLGELIFVFVYPPAFPLTHSSDPDTMTTITLEAFASLSGQSGSDGNLTGKGKRDKEGLSSFFVTVL